METIKTSHLLQVLIVFLLLLSLSKARVEERARGIRCIEKERQALLKFKHELIEDNGRLSSWGDEESKKECCKWRGVRCHNRSNHVTRLDLRTYPNGVDYLSWPMYGNISASLIELQHLEYLDLSLNEFGFAPIPNFFGSFSKLWYLNLSEAYFTGPIPQHLGNLSKLRYVDLKYNNDLYSENLDWVSRLHSLEYLDLSSVSLSKATNWLHAVSKLDSIRQLKLSGVKLPRVPPSSLPPIINVSSSLAILDLSFNYPCCSPFPLLDWFSNFSNSLTSINLDRVSTQTGPIPNVFKKMTSLEHMYLSDNMLEGGIPEYFRNMSRLIDLDLSNNALTGHFPKLISNLSGPLENTLKYLDLGWNGISGLIPNMSRFSSLTQLILSENQLIGPIREGNLQLPNLRVLDLSSNSITGPVPDLSFSSSLQQLLLNNNMFSGPLTETIGSLSKLETLYAFSNLLEGTMTEAHVFNLSRLRSFDLSFNSLLSVHFSSHWVPSFQLENINLVNCKLGPRFPMWLKTQKQLLYIDISNAGISDVVPNWFGDAATQIHHLNASSNNIYGTLPNFLFSKINGNGSLENGAFQMTLDLSRNKISGEINFLCHNTIWYLIDLSDNMLSGRLPDCFAKFQTLSYLNLANNHLFGEIPSSFGSLTTLSLLHLRNNRFSGDFPPTMRNCTNLQMIDLGKNKMKGNIQSWIGDSLLKLKILILHSNEFYGGIPWSLCGLSKIQILDLSSNNFTGFIPKCVNRFTAMSLKENHASFGVEISTVRQTEYTSWPSSLESAYFKWKGKEVKYINNQGLVKLIDLSSNNLIGEIPSGITKLVGLVGLNLSVNNLTGSIPQNIGALDYLNFLDLSRNRLSGGIPTSISEMSSLGVFDVSYNFLSGRIPLRGQALTFEGSDYTGNSGLCGKPLNKSCPGDDQVRQNPNVYKNETDPHDDADKLVTEGFYIAMGFGFIIAFWAVFGTILLNRSLNMYVSFLVQKKKRSRLHSRNNRSR